MLIWGHLLQKWKLWDCSEETEQRVLFRERWQSAPRWFVLLKPFPEDGAVKLLCLTEPASPRTARSTCMVPSQRHSGLGWLVPHCHWWGLCSNSGGLCSWARDKGKPSFLIKNYISWFQMRTGWRTKSDAFSGESWDAKVARQRPFSIQGTLWRSQSPLKTRWVKNIRVTHLV